MSQATDYLLSLDPSVRVRAQEAFNNDQSGRLPGTFIDPYNFFGRRKQTIADVIANNPLIGETLDSQGQFDIPWNARFFGGVNDDDIAKALALKAQRTRKASALGQEAERLGVAFDTVTPDAVFRDKVNKAQVYEKDSGALRGQILALDGGSKALAGMGDKPSIEALSGALNTLQEAAIQKERGRPGGADDQWSRQVGADNRLAKAQENANTLATRQQEQLEYQFDQNQRERSHNAEMARLDRKSERSDKKELFALQMQQNNLDRAYMRERDEREDARADRDKRTAMLMQMVQGLSKLGYGMAI